MQIAKHGEHAIDMAFAAATADIVHRAAEVEEAQRRKVIAKARANAADAREFIASNVRGYTARSAPAACTTRGMCVRVQRAHREAERAAQLAAEDRLLLRLRAELEEQERQQVKAKEHEREGILKSMAENEVIRIQRAEARTKAVEEERSRQRAYEQQVVAAERAHRDKYKHVRECIACHGVR